MRYFLIILLTFFTVSTATVFAKGSTQNPVNGSTQNLPTGSTQNPVNGSTQNPAGGSVELANPLDSSISSIPDFFVAIINILMIFAIPFIVFFIIYAGFLYITARGNPEGIKKAHAALLYALIGGLLILGAKVLLTIITGTVSDIVN